ncbi:MAG: hypothetical protein ACERKO_02630, partial [Acetanaerobacterium sp.]
MAKTATFKIAIGLLSIAIFLCSCGNLQSISSVSDCNQISSSKAENPSSQSSTSKETSVMTDEEIIDLTKMLTTKGNEVFW